MDALRIVGGIPLAGDVTISGSKNASLPLIAAALLAEGPSTLCGVPDLADVRTLSGVLRSLGVAVQQDGSTLHIDATTIAEAFAAYDLVRTMRASFLVLGPLLARMGKAKVSLPGGCAIGARPVDQHLKGLARLGATIHIEHGYVIAEAPAGGLIGAEVVFDMPTVGGTENLMLAASRARGTTVLRNCAHEPEIVDLAGVLRAMGVNVQGEGTDKITIQGRPDPHPYDYRVMPDRIEFGTFVVAGAMAADELRIHNGVPECQSVLIDKLRTAGASITSQGDVLVVRRAPGRPKPVDIETAPYPGYPTDMQAQLMAMMCVADGVSVISETIFENRFMHVAELARLGADIRVDGGKAIIHGVPQLSGTTVMATDLRASASLILAGLIADGETMLRRIYHLDRGYEHIEVKLRALGAKIERFKE